MARSTTTSWRSDAPASIEEARNRLIDSAEACFSRFGVKKMTLDDIANTAGVSRATVYRYFDGGRDEIILGVVLREAHAFLDALRRRVMREPDLADAIVEGVMYTVSSVRKNDNLALLFAPDVAGQTTAIAGASTALFELATDFVRPIFTAAGVEGRLRPGVEAADAAEYVLRIILSILSVSGPKARSQAKEREFVRTYCAGALLAD